MSALWTSAEMEAATLGRASHPFEVTGLSIDTRTIKPGDLFVALKGDNRDGHEFVAAAFAAKAAAALVSRVPEGIAADHALLEVAHTQRALEDLARASRTRSRAKIVAVTGSAGKTTTKEILRHALGALGEVTSSTASYNNHWGVPFSLASLPRHAAFGVFEVGMNHFGEIAFLSDLVRPHVAIITTIAPAHLEFFGNCDSIADAKSEIFGTVVPGGCALVPGDIAQSGRLLARAQQAGVSHILTFGSSENCDARLQSFEDVEGGLRFSAVICGTPVEARLEASGRHIAINAVAALAAVKFLDGDLFNAAAALKVFAPMKGRGQRHEAAGAMVIDESYNANPASMAAALAVLSRAKGRKLAVLGDMLELGTDSTRLHAELGGEIEKAGVDLVFLCGDQMRSLWDALPRSMRGAFAQTSSELVDPVSGALRAGDTVLVKGSNGSRMSTIVDALKART